MEKKLRTFSALTQGDEILIRYNNRDYYLNVIEVKPLTPTKGIQIVEADIRYKEREMKKMEKIMKEMKK